MTATTTPTALDLDATETTHPLDELTAAVMAQQSWAELVQAMSGGYCPTIYGTTRRQRLLTRAIRAAGFRVYTGTPRRK